MYGTSWRVGRMSLIAQGGCRAIGTLSRLAGIFPFRLAIDFVFASHPECQRISSHHCALSHSSTHTGERHQRPIAHSGSCGHFNMTPGIMMRSEHTTPLSAGPYAATCIYITYHATISALVALTTARNNTSTTWSTTWGLGRTQMFCPSHRD